MRSGNQAWMALLALCGAVWTAGAGAEAAAGTALTAVEAEPGGDRYLLVCDGPIRHRLLQTADGMQVTIELPQVANGVPPGSLPGPAGVVRGITVEGGGADVTRVRFNLRRPAVPSTVLSGRGVELRLGVADWEVEEEGREVPVGREDLLEIKVFEIPELARTVRVSESGTISLPLLGEVEAAGLTPCELEERLHGRLQEKYLQDPQVSVFVREHGSRRVSVIGAVGRPGVYQLVGQRRLLQVLSEAGGLTPEVGGYLHVIRDRPDGTSERVTVNVEALMVNRDPGINLEIEPGDVVSVPVDRPVYIYVDGAVKSAGRLEEMESRPISLLQAIAKAGGATERANLKRVQILRQGETGQEILTVNLKRIRSGKDPDPVLRDGDVVVIPETFF